MADKIKHAIDRLEKRGFTINHQDESKVTFDYNQQEVIFYPESGKHSGGSIKPGKGIKNLFKQLI